MAKNLLGKDSAVAQLMVLGKLIFTLIPPKEVAVSESSKVALNCRAKGSLEIVWRRAGQSLPRNHVLYPNGTLLL